MNTTKEKIEFIRVYQKAIEQYVMVINSFKKRPDHPLVSVSATMVIKKKLGGQKVFKSKTTII